MAEPRTDAKVMHDYCEPWPLADYRRWATESVKSSPDPSPQGGSAAHANWIRLLGSRAALLSTYRATSLIPAEHREVVVELTAVMGDGGAGLTETAIGHFEAVARNCLTALYLMATLGLPALATRHCQSAQPGERLKGECALGPAERLSLFLVRAVSAGQVEYIFQPMLSSASHEKLPPLAQARRRPAFALARLRSESTPGLTIWATKRGLEGRLDLLPHLSLPGTRSELVERLACRSRVGSRDLSAGLLGLDEKRFTKDLGTAFQLLAGPTGMAPRKAAGRACFDNVSAVDDNGWDS